MISQQTVSVRELKWYRPPKFSTSYPPSCAARFRNIPYLARECFHIPTTSTWEGIPNMRGLKRTKKRRYSTILQRTYVRYFGPSTQPLQRLAMFAKSPSASLIKPTKNLLFHSRMFDFRKALISCTLTTTPILFASSCTFVQRKATINDLSSVKHLAVAEGETYEGCPYHSYYNVPEPLWD